MFSLEIFSLGNSSVALLSFRQWVIKTALICRVNKNRRRRRTLYEGRWASGLHTLNVQNCSPVPLPSPAPPPNRHLCNRSRSRHVQLCTDRKRTVIGQFSRLWHHQVRQRREGCWSLPEVWSCLIASGSIMRSVRRLFCWDSLTGYSVLSA